MPVFSNSPHLRPPALTLERTTSGFYKSALPMRGDSCLISFSGDEVHLAVRQRTAQPVSCAIADLRGGPHAGQPVQSTPVHIRPYRPSRLAGQRTPLGSSVTRSVEHESQTGSPPNYPPCLAFVLAWCPIP